jgi:hypothetical protein
MYTSIMTVTITRPAGEKVLRDIRADLEARITAIGEVMERTKAKFEADQEKLVAEHKKLMDNFKHTLANYRHMLTMEEAFANMSKSDENKIGPVPNQVEIQMPMRQMSLADFFFSKVEQFGGLSKEKLRALAHQASYFRPGENGGRQTHATLFNMVRNGRIRFEKDGNYVLANKETPELL